MKKFCRILGLWQQPIRGDTMVENIVQSVTDWQVIGAAVIFLVCYALIISEKVNRG